MSTEVSRPPTPARTGVTSFVAPARVNPTGKHPDYTRGYVLPRAIAFATTATIRSVAEDFHFQSDMFATERRITPGDRSPRIGDWSDYPVGVLRELQALNIELPPFELPPFELKLSGDVPPGAGLSSSASVEVATAMALLSFAGRELPAAQIATLCRRAENDYVGSPCGIMDQFVVTAARAEHALLLHTRDLFYELVPLNIGSMADCAIVVINSMVRHSIADGDYGLRRRELEAGQQVLLAAYPGLRDLGDATLDQLASCAPRMSPASFRRCRHVITENARVLEAKAALLAGDAARLGKLMTQAHASERNDFECSVEEVDFLVDSALSLPGCLGARLTGGGFGGCTVNLVHQRDAESFAADLLKRYQERCGITGESYLCAAVDGAVARALQQEDATSKESLNA